MNSIKRKLVLLGLLANIASVSLTGCGENVHRFEYADIEIIWINDEVLRGSVPYDDIEHIKVVILEQNGTIMPYLIGKEQHRGKEGNNVIYINLKNGVTMLEYFWENDKDILNDEPDNIILGKYTTILEEIDFYDYLYEYGDIINDLDITEIIKIYDDIEPELIEYISKEYNYTKSISN